MEDMDLSISDMEDVDDDYVASATDDEWAASEKIHIRKRKSKSRVSMENNQSNVSSPEACGETASDICCSCSKSSSCKTNKCKCRALGGSCGSSCGCLASKCANRASVTNTPQVEGTGSDSSVGEADTCRLLAAQGAELLQGALVEGPADAHSDHGPRKPLSDIGNTLVRGSHALKNWENSSI